MITDEQHRAVKHFYTREAETLCIAREIPLEQRPRFIEDYTGRHTHIFVTNYRSTMEIIEKIHLGVESDVDRPFPLEVFKRR